MKFFFNFRSFKSRKKVTKSFFSDRTSNGFTNIMSEAFHHTAVQNIFENTGGRVDMLVMNACGNFTFN